MLGKLFGRKRREETDDDPEQLVMRAVVGFLEAHRQKMAAQTAASAMVERYTEGGKEAAFAILGEGRSVVFDREYYFYASKVAILACARALDDLDEEGLVNISLSCLVHAFGFEPEMAGDLVLESMTRFPYGDGGVPTGDAYETLNDGQKKLADLRSAASAAAAMLVAGLPATADRIDIDSSFVDPVADRLDMRVDRPAVHSVDRGDA